MATRVRFWRQVEPQDGPVNLRFGAWPGITLRFARPVSTASGPVALVFGPYVAPEFPTIAGTLSAVLPAPDAPPLALVATGEEVQPPIDATLAATLPAAQPPALQLLAIDGTTVAQIAAAALPAAELPSMSADVAVAYNIDLPDADGVGIRSRFQSLAPARPVPLTVRAHQMQPTRTPAWMRQQQAQPLAAGLTSPHAHMLTAQRGAVLPFAHGLRRQSGLRAGYADALRSRRHLRTDYAHGLRATTGFRADYAEAIRRRRFVRAGHAQGLPTATGAPVRHAHGLPFVLRLRADHAQMLPLPVGWWQATYPWPDPPPGVEPPGPVDLVFCRLADGTTRLVFGCPLPDQPAGPVVVPILRSYIVVNDVTLVRVSNALPITALSVEARIDADSWGWGWSASVPAGHLDDLLPAGPADPVELELEVNGVAWRLLVERITRDRLHARDRLNISGRGIAAQLADPLYPAESRDNTAGALTAQQLAAAALTINGVPLGWALNWQAPDWSVPAGAWVHTGTPMDAVVRIAQAAGAYVQADRSAKTLHVLPRYPALPWEWAAQTPAFILPSAATTRESTEFVERPGYDVVYVAGTDVGGILGQVKRAGTAGNLPAEMVVDPLITHADAARGRGAAILGDTGRKQILTLDTPVIDNIGVYPVGSLIEWTEGQDARRGIVRSLRVAAQLPRVRQSIEVECNG